MKIQLRNALRISTTGYTIHVQPFQGKVQGNVVDPELWIVISIFQSDISINKKSLQLLPLLFQNFVSSFMLLHMQTMQIFTCLIMVSTTLRTC